MCLKHRQTNTSIFCEIFKPLNLFLPTIYCCLFLAHARSYSDCGLNYLIWVQQSKSPETPRHLMRSHYSPENPRTSILKLRDSMSFQGPSPRLEMSCWSDQFQGDTMRTSASIPPYAGLGDVSKTPVTLCRYLCS